LLLFHIIVRWRVFYYPSRRFSKSRHRMTAYAAVYDMQGKDGVVKARRPPSDHGVVI
jgi:hypothetical protein